MAEGPYTLALSSAFFGFYAHCGATEAIFEAGLPPAKITGASAGALVGAAFASGLSPEQIRKLMFDLKREDFWDPGLGLGLLRGQKFRRLAEASFAKRFSDAKIPFAVSVFDVLSLRTRYHSEGEIAPAVVASCAVPLMFQPVWLGGRPSLDGGLLNKSGIHPGSGRVLCVYLESVRPARREALLENQMILRFRDFPRVTPTSLERGTWSHQDVWARTRRALDRKISGPVLDG